MSTEDRTPKHIKLDERNHVEKPMLDQIDVLGWEIIDLDSKQHPVDILLFCPWLANNHAGLEACK